MKRRKSPFKKFTPFKSQALDSAQMTHRDVVMISNRSAHPRSIRPVDKLIKSIVKTAIDATQQAIILMTVTFPCTIVGLRWDLSAGTTAGTASSDFSWAIVKVTDGDTANALTITDASTLYAPEQMVMVWGQGQLPPFDKSANQVIWLGETKTMRKMMGGDQLQFICKGEATNVSRVVGGIQFFCKT